LENITTEQITNQIINQAIGINLGIKESLLILAFSVISGFILRYLFNSFSNSFSSRFNLGNSILLITMSVASLIAVVKSSLALSLGLVGALSVVRFRTAIKEPYNLAFILLSICIGISIGASQFIFAMMLLITGSIIVVFIYKKGVESNRKNEVEVMLDSISLTISKNQKIVEIFEVLDQYCESYSIKSFNSEENSDTRLTFNVNILDHTTLNELIENIKNKGICSEITFYTSPQY
jgi:sulfur relay (sulfurtransferase) DsrF/TusC family protein